MSFVQALSESFTAVLPAVVAMPLLLIPFIVAEQLWPVNRRPTWRDYGFNILVSTSTLLLALPFGVLSGMGAAALRSALPWTPIGFSYDSIASVPVVGHALAIVAMTIVPILFHDLWFYWAHRIEHRVAFLWEFHKLHHSDELLNCSTWARDHFMQATWITVFPAFGLGLVFDISAVQAGMAALLSTLFLSLLSMFYHSAIKIELPWLDRVLVTPQVHRIHHSRDRAHFDRNFADAFPLFDIIFGTYSKPRRGEFPLTGLDDAGPPPRNLWNAQGSTTLLSLKQLTRTVPSDVRKMEQS